MERTGRAGGCQSHVCCKKLTATQTTHERQTALENAHTHSMYFAEYEMLSGEQNFLNAVQNYLALKGQQTNLFKCFLPLSWEKTNESGIAAFVHPEGVYDDPKCTTIHNLV